MNIKDFKEALPYIFKANTAPFVWGHAGIGKTSIVKDYAKSKGYHFFAMYLGTQSDVGDILGLASFTKDENGQDVATHFATPIWLKEAIEYCQANPESGAIIFLDEFNRGRRDIMQGMFSLALDKKFHTLQLPENMHIIAAGNPPTDEYSVTDITDTALLARFVHIKLEPSVDEWLTYAKDSKIEPTIISFIQEQPTLLEEQKSDFELPVKVDRRAYERLSRFFAIKTPDGILTQLMRGIIGIERTVAYELHLKSREKPLTGEEVLAGLKLDQLKTWSNMEDTKSSLVNASCDNLKEHMVALYKAGTNVTDEQMVNFQNFIYTCPKDSVYTMLKDLNGLTKDSSSKAVGPYQYLQADDALYGKFVKFLKECKGIKE